MEPGPAVIELVWKNALSSGWDKWPALLNDLLRQVEAEHFRMIKAREHWGRPVPGIGLWRDGLGPHFDPVVLQSELVKRGIHSPDELAACTAIGVTAAHRLCAGGVGTHPMHRAKVCQILDGQDYGLSMHPTPRAPRIRRPSDRQVLRQVDEWRAQGGELRLL